MVPKEYEERPIEVYNLTSEMPLDLRNLLDRLATLEVESKVLDVMFSGNNCDNKEENQESIKDLAKNFIKEGYKSLKQLLMKEL